MLIQVNWRDNRYDYVKDFRLDPLIKSGNVVRFLRSTGWVTVGVDPVRDLTRKEPYHGVERRTAHYAET